MKCEITPKNSLKDDRTSSQPFKTGLGLTTNWENQPWHLPVPGLSRGTRTWANSSMFLLLS